jgi:hypothetical protein
MVVDQRGSERFCAVAMRSAAIKSRWNTARSEPAEHSGGDHYRWERSVEREDRDEGGERDRP